MDHEILQEVTELVRKQQDGRRGPVWMCGEQLLEMIGQDEAAAKLVLDDLQHGGLSLAECEKKIRGFAQKNGNCCTGPEAEKIIRDYFGLPERGTAQKPALEPAAGVISLEDFF